MPLFRLSEQIDFPPAALARSDGLLCVGGDLSPKRLILAYERGIFPWFSHEDPILWWSPDPRLVLYPNRIHISKSLKKSLRKKKFTIQIDTAFEKTIKSCAEPRKQHDGTWLVDEMIEAYIALHYLGFAHSVETWVKDQLVGGLYGICLGRCFFGESMFSIVPDASKAALSALAKLLMRNHFDLIDCQVSTTHLTSMGAQEIPRALFLKIISESVKKKPDADIWNSAHIPND